MRRESGGGAEGRRKSSLITEMIMRGLSGSTSHESVDSSKNHEKRSSLTSMVRDSFRRGKSEAVAPEHIPSVDDEVELTLGMQEASNLDTNHTKSLPANQSTSSGREGSNDAPSVTSIESHEDASHHATWSLNDSASEEEHPDDEMQIKDNDITATAELEDRHLDYIDVDSSSRPFFPEFEGALGASGDEDGSHDDDDDESIGLVSTDGEIHHADHPDDASDDTLDLSTAPSPKAYDFDERGYGFTDEDLNGSNGPDDIAYTDKCPVQATIDASNVGKPAASHAEMNIGLSLVLSFVSFAVGFILTAVYLLASEALP